MYCTPAEPNAVVDIRSNLSNKRFLPLSFTVDYLPDSQSIVGKLICELQVAGKLCRAF